MNTTCGWDELKYLEYMKDKLPENPVMFDVGFNKGDFTREWLARFPNSKVHGFEPIKALFELGQKNFQNDKRVVLHNFGLHNESKSSIIYFLQNGYDGMSSIHYRPKYYPKFKYTTETVLLKRFDEAPKSFDMPDFIKADTEGNELFVLQGMSNLLENNPPKFIQFEVGECINDAGVTFKEIIEFLYSKKYMVYNRDFNEINPQNVWENTDLQNYLAVYSE